MNHVDRIRKAFSSLKYDSKSFDLFSMRIDHNECNGEIAYHAQSICVRSAEERDLSLSRLCDKYVGGRKTIISEEFNVRRYDASALDEHDAFFVSQKDQLICKSSDDFLRALMDAGVECNAEEITPNAMVLANNDYKFVSAYTPITMLKNKFWFCDGEYSIVDKPILTMPTKVDAIIIGDICYFLTIAGAQVFVSESISKKVALEKTDLIAELPYLKGVEALKAISQSGLNPRRFLGFNQQRVDDMKDAKNRCKIAKIFGITCKGGCLDLSEKGDAERFIKVVCNRGMMDPFTDDPVEVTGSKSWSR